LLHAIIAITAPYLPPSAETSPLFAAVRRDTSAPWSTIGDFEPLQSVHAPPVGSNLQYQAFHRRKALERIAEQSERFYQLIPAMQGEHTPSPMRVQDPDVLAQVIVAELDLLNAKYVARLLLVGRLTRVEVYRSGKKQQAVSAWAFHFCSTNRLVSWPESPRSAEWR
jgi:hypothetical protein